MRSSGQKGCLPSRAKKVGQTSHISMSELTRRFRSFVRRPLYLVILERSTGPFLLRRRI